MKQLSIFKIIIILQVIILIFLGCSKNIPITTEDMPIQNEIVQTHLEAETTNIQMEIMKMNKLPIGNPSDFGFSQIKLNEIDSFIQNEVDLGFPGAVLLIAKDGHIIHNQSYGYAKKYDGITLLENPEKMTDKTMFDIASLTKVYGTMFAIMKLIDDGYLMLDDKISKHLDGYDNGNKEQITIRMLLNHSAGYGDDIRFFDNYAEYADMFYSTNREKTITLLDDIELSNYPGETHKYSDIGYMILCQLIEKVTGLQLDLYLRDYIYKPLGIENQILYNPLDNGFTSDYFAATERMGNTRDGVAQFNGIRDYTLQGSVHDEKTYYSMSGVSGHSGLFADVDALAILSQVLLNGGQYNDVQLISQDTLNTFTTIYDEQKYQLTLNSAKSNKYLTDFVSDSSLYHYGWTGTAIVADPTNNMSIILLTNKRHSPCDWDDFEGNANYETGKYVSIIKMIYQALNKQ